MTRSTPSSTWTFPVPDTHQGWADAPPAPLCEKPSRRSWCGDRPRRPASIPMRWKVSGKSGQEGQDRREMTLMSSAPADGRKVRTGIGDLTGLTLCK
jgi:hypothetical protein